MGVKLLFIVDPLESLKAYKDSSVAMMRAAQARGHAIWAAEQTHLHWSKNRVSAQATRISLTDNDEDWYRGHETELKPLKDYAAVLMRKDPPFDLEYVASTWLLSAAVREGVKVFNSPDAIRDHNEKLAIAEFGAFVAPTLVIGGIQDQIVDGESGVLVDDPTDLETFGRAVTTVLRDPALAGRLGPAARQRVRDHFLPLHHFEREGDVLERVLG